MMEYFYSEKNLKLCEKEEEIFMSEAKELENADEILELPISYEERGKAKGREEGIKIGIRKGMQEGMQEGMQKGMKEVALKMLADGFNDKKIMELTNLSREEIGDLKKQVE